MTLILAGCAGGNELKPSQAAYDTHSLTAGREIVTAHQDASSASPLKQWWCIFHDPQLDRLMAMAEKDAPTIQMASARLEAADAASAAVAADLQPYVNAEGSISGDHFPGHYIYASPYADDYGSDGSITADVRYHLDFWGKWRTQAVASRLKEHAAGYQVADARLLIATEVAQAYAGLEAAYRLRDTAAEGLALRKRSVDLLAIRQRAGLSTQIDAVQAEEAVTATRSEIDQLDAEIERRRYEIAALLGKTPAFADALKRPAMDTISDPAPLSAVPAALIGYRPDVMARRDAVEAAAKEIGVARADFYPDVDLVGFAGLQSLGIGYLLRASSMAASLGPALTLPIFEGGRLRANLKGRIAEYDEAVSGYNASIVAALRQVADGIALLKAARARQHEARVAETYWTHVVSLQKLRQRSGLSDAYDCLTAETSLLLVRRRVTEAEAGVTTAQISLIRALGGAWAPSSPLVSNWTPHD